MLLSFALFTADLNAELALISLLDFAATIISLANFVKSLALAAALEANERARPQYRAASDRAMSYQPKGDSECARTVDTVRALVMGGGR